MDDHARDPPVEARLARTLRDGEETVAVAETATGGLVAALLTAPAGASDYFDRGWVAYAYDSLREELAVARETLDEHGAVSAPVVRDLARGARDRARADWGVATAAIAGPEGGGPDRPVGTAFIAVAAARPWGSGDSGARVRRYRFPPEGRGAVRERVARRALWDLRAELRTRE